MTRAAELHQASKIAAVERLGPDADDAAIANCACEMLAEALADALKDTLDALTEARREPPLDPDPLDAMEDRELEYERACRRNGEEM